MITRTLLPAALALSLFAGACAAAPVGNRNVPEPAAKVDLKLYAGLWYEQARYEQWFEKDCEAVTAEYGLLSNGKVSVKNTCRKGAVDGPVKVSEGKAKPVGDPLGAKLKVSFFGPFYVGNYWVLDHAPDYSWSIVGEGSGKYLWILTRKKVLSDAERTVLIARAGDLGYDVGLLRTTRQSR